MTLIDRRRLLTVAALSGLGVLSLTAEKQCSPSSGGSGPSRHNPHRAYPCGTPDDNDPGTWEYTVTIPEDPGHHGGRVFIICGHKKASRYKAEHPDVTVERTA